MSHTSPAIWDSHVHIIDPSRYPMVPDAAYTPGIYTAWDNALFEDSIGALGNTIIQPSIFGNDNSELLQTLQANGPNRSRGVVVFDPNPNVTSQAILREWHALGVRGVRVNLGFVGTIPTPVEFSKTLRAYADVIRPFNWVLQMYIPMSLIGEMEDVFLTLGVRVIFDHLGHPELPELNTTSVSSPLNPYTLSGFQAFANLLKSGKAWTKISAPYRLSKTGGPQYTDLDPLITELLKIAPDQLVYASDWPHVLFEGLDIRPWTLHLAHLTGKNEELRLKIFRRNAELLWN